MRRTARKHKVTRTHTLCLGAALGLLPCILQTQWVGLTALGTSACVLGTVLGWYSHRHHSVRSVRTTRTHAHKSQGTAYHGRMGYLLFLITTRNLSTPALEIRLKQYLHFLDKGYNVMREVNSLERRLIARGANLAN